MDRFRSLMSVATLPTSPAPFPRTAENNNVSDNVRSESSSSSASTVSTGHGNEESAAKSPLPIDPCDEVFDQICYLGCSRIENPSNESEMLQIVSSLNREKSHDPVNVILTIPPCSSGTVRLFDSESRSEMCSFPIHRIRFCARGQSDSQEKECFALSFVQNNSSQKGPALHQCHVFRCHVPEAAGKALFCFANAFRYNEVPLAKLTANGTTSPAGSTAITPGSEEDYQFEAFLEIREEDSKKGFTVCPQEKSCFKLRRNREKKVVVVLQQKNGPRLLTVKKCFGLLLAAGRHLRESDMHLLDMQDMGQGQNPSVYVIEALWNPNARNFEVLNTETPRETRVFMTVAVDVILQGIDEPVRFNMEAKARIFHEHERFWYVTRRAIVERYFLTIKMDLPPSSISPGEDDPSTASTSAPQNGSAADKENLFKVVKFESVTERERSMARLSLGRSPTKMPTQLIHPADDDESDSDEPLLSGSGEVNRECAEDVMAEWKDVLQKWKDDAENSRPKELSALIRNGIPDVLRGEVWQLLAKVNADIDLIDTYRLLLAKDCPSEQVILRDIHRTFPAHAYFREANGDGQEALFKISKAYSLYDEEVSYCQGLSFLGAALLLHMPEEQAFCVLIKIMFDYGLRDLFKLGFDVLHLRFYQLHRLIEDYAPDLFAHFYNLGVETHMYASQWFLTLFTAKFPLQMVFFIVDLFLSEGMNTIFHISLALLNDSKKDLLQLDFEGALKYFRVALPRKYRTENSAKELIHSAVKLKISHKRLSKYEKEYYSLKEKELESQDPQERLERENLRLKDTVMRLERENDDLAHELVTSKIELRNKLDTTEDQLESCVANVERKTRENKDLEEENRSLHQEYEQVKEMCRREVVRLELETTRNQTIIANYKKICSDLSRRFEDHQEKVKEEHKEIASRVAGCDRCRESLSDCLGEEGSPVHKASPTDEEGGFKALQLMEKLSDYEDHIKHIELELAQTKLALVEAQCRNQDLTHQMNTSVTNNSESDGKTAWFKKTISSIKEVRTSLKNPERSNSSVSADHRHS
ncbi:hypothetical protein QR680_019302 [Steinernema hermaphroditum]|uniref:Rab-GAP TBC domain-containing protein n=1 Tax=Steinernema hermaphroditum TaxID=289476 RepID=A0AA39GNL8_9BILA|nr:hypothetical protein QR680_019302 [Steinernema hermaphroditum]